MTNNTINVPRELLENIVLCYNEGEFELGTLAAECHALLSAPSPAGVDGLEVGDVECNCSWNPDSHDKTCPVYLRDRLSDAQAIIDGLRGEVAAQRVKTCIALKERNDAREERDRLAQWLKFARTTMAVVADNANLRGVEHRSLTVEVNRIDAALSAGKEGAQ